MKRWILFCFIAGYIILLSVNTYGSKRSSSKSFKENYYFDFRIRTPKTNQLIAKGFDSRIDLRWRKLDDPEVIGYNVYRANRSDGEYLKINKEYLICPVYSDFVGKVNIKYYYVIVAVYRNNEKKQITGIVSAEQHQMEDEQLITSIQLATFRGFWDACHPVSKMAVIGTRRTELCPIGANGFYLAGIPVAIERGFISRMEGAARILEILDFLENKAERYHGAWAHWVYGHNGETRHFATRKDNGADLVETSFLAMGFLILRQYFNKDIETEIKIRETITRLWESIDWAWFLNGGKSLHWHWSPDYGFEKGVTIKGYNECLITYILASMSPTHAIPADCYDKGWVTRGYVHNKNYYAYRQPLGPTPMGGPLFLTQYSFIGLDPTKWRDNYCDYFEHCRNVTLINRTYCIENPKGYKGYSSDFWGLTSSYSPKDFSNGYWPSAPGDKDMGVIAPTAALCAMPFTYRHSLNALKHFYYRYSTKGLWGEFGFKDALCPQLDWISDMYLSLDQAPIISMIENARTGLCWNLFMSNPEVEPGLKRIGWFKK